MDVKGEVLALVKGNVTRNQLPRGEIDAEGLPEHLPGGIPEAILILLGMIADILCCCCRGRRGAQAADREVDDDAPTNAEPDSPTGARIPLYARSSVGEAATADLGDGRSRRSGSRFAAALAPVRHFRWRFGLSLVCLLVGLLLSSVLALYAVQKVAVYGLGIQNGFDAD